MELGVDHPTIWKFIEELRISQALFLNFFQNLTFLGEKRCAVRKVADCRQVACEEEAVHPLGRTNLRLGERLSESNSP
jgi:hypothetical protein